MGFINFFVRARTPQKRVGTKTRAHLRIYTHVYIYTYIQFSRTIFRRLESAERRRRRRGGRSFICRLG